MKRLFFVLLLAVPSRTALGANPIFGETQNQISLGLGYKNSDSGGGMLSMFDLIHGRPESLYFFSLHYSQPDTNFRLPGRRNLELIALRGTGKDMKRYSQRALGASWDTVLLHGEQFYLGFSVGVYLKDKIDDRINAQFTFGEKFFLGYRFPRLNLEFFLRHFSTGYLTTINRGYNFVGVAAALNY